MMSNARIGFRRFCSASRYEGPYDYRTQGSFSPPLGPARPVPADRPHWVADPT
jgi:hypothetical protein